MVGYFRALSTLEIKVVKVVRRCECATGFDSTTDQPPTGERDYES